MQNFPIFLSVVYIVRNHANQLEGMLHDATSILCNLVSDYELIIIDNGSDDNSLVVLKELTQEDGLANLQVYALTKEVDFDTAAWVGLDNALGDYIAVINPCVDDITFLPAMIDKVVDGVDIVFANNREKPKHTLIYNLTYLIFNLLYKWCAGVHLAQETPQYRILSKKIVNFILQHPQPAITYRHLRGSGGFARINLEYSCPPKMSEQKRITESIDRGLNLLVSSTQAPMRLVTFLTLFGAIANIIYSIYILTIAFLKVDVAPGWVSLSLQQSGMFFLMSLVLLVLGEYILNMVRLQNDGPLYHVGEEYTSTKITRRNKLNIEVLTSVPQKSNSFEK